MKNNSYKAKISEENINELAELADESGRSLFARLDSDKLMSFISKHIDTNKIWDFLKDENNYIDGKISDSESMNQVESDEGDFEYEDLSGNRVTFNSLDELLNKIVEDLNNIRDKIFSGEEVNYFDIVLRFDCLLPIAESNYAYKEKIISAVDDFLATTEFDPLIQHTISRKRQEIKEA